MVVDNCSTDDTRRVVENTAARLPNLHYCYEERRGSAIARNRGWQEAVGDIIAFMDDDAQARPDWLEAAARIIRDLSPDVFGGPIYPFYQSPKPDWFKDEYGAYVVGGEARWLTSPDEYLYGSNLFVQRTVLQAVGGFDERLGMKGGRIGYGEETALMRAARRLSPAAGIYYDPGLIVYHLVRPEKMHFAWQLRHRFAQGRDGYLTFTNGVHRMTPRHMLGLLALPVILILEATLGALLRDRRTYPYPQNFYYERVFQRIATLGKLYQRLLCALGAGRDGDG
jgi:glycosyltransferase involved in cell wall biosynthesis